MIKYEEYMKELQLLKDNLAMIKLKNEIKDTVDNFKDRVAQLELNHSRYLKIKGILGSILTNSGISIQNLQDLK
jgi:hypothetical protein